MHTCALSEKDERRIHQDDLTPGRVADLLLYFSFLLNAICPRLAHLFHFSLCYSEQRKTVILSSCIRRVCGMGRFVNPDNQAFKMALNSEIYVDKSGLINFTNKLLCTGDNRICNSRPRRFGKSMTANMLSAYYSKGADSKEMFSSLEIGSSPDFEKHLNKYDVIHLDIQECIDPAGGPEKVVSYINREVIRELKKYCKRKINTPDF